LQFLQARDIGILGWALDVVNSLIADWRYTPTSLTGFQCGVEFSYGAGELFKSNLPAWQPHVSPCATGVSDKGVAAIPVDIPESGEYRLWSRVMKSRLGTGSGVSLLQVDDACPVPAWDPVVKDGRWSWTTGDGALLWLEKGQHTLRFLGGPGGVNLDRIALTADEDCVPGYPTEDCTL
jgi:hypothetical protein